MIRRFNSTLIKELSQYKPRPLSAAEYIQFEKSGSMAESFKFCRHELPIRLINIIEEGNALPVMFGPGKFQEIKEKYTDTLDSLLPFINAEINEENIEKFDKEISKIIHRHRYVIEKLSIGIQEFSEGIDAKDIAQTEEKIHYFLDRFLINRTAAKLLCHQHLQHSAAAKNKEYRQGNRCFQLINVNELVTRITEKVQTECEAYFKRRVEMELLSWDGEIEGPCEKVETIFIPVHLEEICYNMIKNAMRATIEHNEEPMPPLKILISKGKNNVVIKISDRGGGASLDEQLRWSAYLYSTGKDLPAENLNSPITVPMVGYGFGIPYSKVLARYLGGDVSIRSMEGYGTDVYIHLQTDPTKLFEVLPVYTSKTESFYKTKNMANEWITGKEQKVSFTSN